MSNSSSGGPPVALILGVCAFCCCVSSLLGGAGWYTNSFCDSLGVGQSCPATGAPSPDQTNTPGPTPSQTPGPAPRTPGPAPSRAPGPAPSQNPTDPRVSVWSSSGQLIQGNPVDPATLSGPLQVTPAPLGGSSNTYSFSVDIKLSSTWNTVGGSNYALFQKTGALLVGLTTGGGPGQRWWETNGIVIYQSTVGQSPGAGNQNWQVYPNVLVPGTWVNLTVVCDGTNVNLYVNGVLNTNISGGGTRTNTTGITWSAGAWQWGGLNPEVSSDPVPTGKSQMANFYWWSNRVLTASQISQLAVPTAPTPGVATTSYYMPEPYTVSGFKAY